MNIDRFRAGFGRLPGRSRPFGLRPQTRHEPLDPAALDHYWHPDRPNVESAPRDIRQALLAIHPKLRCVRPPMGAPIHHGYHAWIVWFANTHVTHRLCPGWSLVFIWQHPDTKEPLPLDNRFFANVYMRDPRLFRRAVDYYDTCVTNLLRVEEAEKRTFQQESYDRQKSLNDYQKIKNIGMGNKFPLHHDGTNIASRGETNWRTETLYDRLPDEVRRLAEKEGKNTKGRVSVSVHPDRIGHAVAARDFANQLEMLKLLKDRRERVGARVRRSSVGYTGPVR